LTVQIFEPKHLVNNINKNNIFFASVLFGVYNPELQAAAGQRIRAGKRLQFNF
jgi:hypothetical protein